MTIPKPQNRPFGFISQICEERNLQFCENILYLTWLTYSEK